MEESNVFDVKRLSELFENLSVEQPKYFICADTVDKDVSAYCLAKTYNGEFHFILTKRMRSGKEFDEEVANLAKYFNAEFVKEVSTNEVGTEV
jgi:hypothetical protein